MIGILCPMPKEVEPFLAEIARAETCSVGGFEYIRGKLRGRDVIVSKCGVGKVNAAACAQAMLLTWPVKLVVNSGVAGSMREDLGVGDICVAEELAQYDVDTSAAGDPPGFVSTVEKIYFRCAPWAVEGLLRAARSIEGARAISGRIATGDRFLHEAADKARVVRLFGASAVDMEGCAVAQVCHINGVDCAVVRAISDSTTGGHAQEYSRYMPAAARTAAEATLRFLENLKDQTRTDEL